MSRRKVPEAGVSGDALSVRAAAREAPDSPAVVVVNRGSRSGRERSWAELADRSVDWVQALIAGTRPPVPGWTPHVGVPMVATPDLDTLVAACACLEAGWPFVPVHPRWTSAEARDWTRRTTGLDRPLGPIYRNDPPSGSEAPAWRPGPPEPEQIAAVLPTSGSTGQPKGVELSRRALVASARASAACLGWRRGDRWLLTLPLAHVGGFSILTRCLEARRTVVLPPPSSAGAGSEPGFRPSEVLWWVEAGGVTLLSLVPTMLRRLLESGHSPPSHLRAVLVGGAAASPELMAAARDRGWPVLATYGLTEACSQVATEHPSVLETRTPGARAGTGVGRPLDDVEVRITGGGSEEGGVLELRGPTLFSGYRCAPGEVEPGRDRQGWLSTGDLAHLDDRGHLHILGRRDHVIVTGGENVHPAEVERALERHPAVAVAGVFGVPDPEWGQVVAALLVARAPSAGDVLDRASGPSLPGLPELRAFLEPHLAPYKRPRRLRWVEELPRTPAGKLDRRALARRPE